MNNIKKLTLNSVLFNILLIMPIFSFAAISEQNKVNFKNIYSSSEIKPKTYTNILNFCGENDTDIDSCLVKLKAQPSYQSLTQNQIKGGVCCVNVSGFVGEYAYIRGQSYCIPPC